jgi:hypothetical protein
VCLETKLIPITPAFLEYLRADSIVLADDDDDDSSNTAQEDSNWEDSEAQPDPTAEFPDFHQAIKDAIVSLGGSVAPKLNWSAPKDAAWIMLKTNSMECYTPNDIYLLLKSSNFITHDLEHAFDDCPPLSSDAVAPTILYTLVLRKYRALNPAFEFRCFVRNRTLLAISQRDLNHYDFLLPMKETLQPLIEDFFEDYLQDSFPDPNFVFDIYIEDGKGTIRLIDINPFTPTTDPLLFSWLELLTLKLPMPLLGVPESDSTAPLPTQSSDEDTDAGEEEKEFVPELRMVGKDDPEANGGGSQYSAYKLPKEVVDASLGGEESMREFTVQWREMMEAMERQGTLGQESDEDED